MTTPIDPERFKINEFRRIIGQVEKLYHIWFDAAYRNRILAEQLDIPIQLVDLHQFIMPTTFRQAAASARIYANQIQEEEQWYETHLDKDPRVRQLVTQVDADVGQFIYDVDNYVFHATHETNGPMVLAKRMR